jgi:hypothetical protein
MIRETIVSTMNASGKVHFAPIGLIAEGSGWIIAPFYPSTTLSNLRTVPFAAANFTEDVRVFAGCLTGRSQWPTAKCEEIPVPRLAKTLAHSELAVTSVSEDDQRPRFHCRVVCTTAHEPFRGFNRAQAAVIEAAILVSRLHLLPREKIESEMAYLQNAVGKTASSAEEEAWGWLADTVRALYDAGQKQSASHDSTARQRQKSPHGK